MPNHSDVDAHIGPGTLDTGSPRRPTGTIMLTATSVRDEKTLNRMWAAHVRDATTTGPLIPR